MFIFMLTIIVIVIALLYLAIPMNNKDEIFSLIAFLIVWVGFLMAFTLGQDSVKSKDQERPAQINQPN